MPTVPTSPTEALIAEISAELQISIRRAARTGRSTVGEDWNRRQHAEAQAYLGLPGSPFESAVHDSKQPTVYVLSDEALSHLKR